MKWITLQATMHDLGSTYKMMWLEQLKKQGVV